MAKKSSGKKNTNDDVLGSTKFELNYTVAPPEIMSRDVLAEMTDDALSARLDALNNERNVVATQSGGVTSIPWEVELSYTHRELEARINRRQAHERYESGQ